MTGVVCTLGLSQGLFFSSVPSLGYGLVQPEGGPCGALAVIQAFTVKHLLWRGSMGADWKQA